MSVLSKQRILERLKSGDLSFDPAVDEKSVDYVSIDLRLGRKFSLLKKDGLPGHIPSIVVDPSLYNDPQFWEHSEADSFKLAPNRLVITYTMEIVKIPLDLVGFVEGRSRWARTGVSVHITAPKIDPGFNAPIALEMVNLSPWTIELRAGIDRPAQLILMDIDPPLSSGYGSSDQDIFQYQTDPVQRRR